MRKNIIGLLLVFMLIGIYSIPSYGNESFYAIQLGSFQNNVGAQTYVEQLKEMGISSYTYNNGVHHIVVHGKYAIYEEALKNLEGIREMVSDAFITKLYAFVKKTSSQQIQSVPKEEKTPALETFLPEVMQEAQVLNQVFYDDIMLNGFYGSYSTFIDISARWDVLENSNIRLFYSHSIPNEYRGSSITLFINGQPIESQIFDAKKPTLKEWIIPIDPKVLREGSNEISFRTFHRMTALPCEDENNPALWVKLHGDSVIHIAYKEKQSLQDLRDYPYPYLDIYMDRPVNFSFVVDEGDLSSHVIKAIYTMSADLGRRASNKDLQFSIVSPNDLENIDSHCIVIGTQIPPSLAYLFEDDFKLEQNKIYIMEKNRDDQYFLFLLSTDSKNLNHIARLFTQDDLILQMSSEMILESNEIPIIKMQSVVKNKITLEEIGYGNIILSGSKYPSTSFFIDFPNNWDIQSGANLTLRLRYSNSIDFRNSSVNVLINNIPIGSVRLTEEMADDFILSLDLPRDVLRSKAFNIQLQFSLAGELSCEDMGQNNAYWAFIANNSYVYLPHIQKPIYDLKDYPAPFVSNYYFEKLNMVFDKKTSYEALTLGANIMGFMGRSLRSFSDFDIVMGDTLPIGNNIVIASSGSSLIRKNNSLLHIRYDPSFQSFEKNDAFLWIGDFAKNISTAQLITRVNSPYSTLFITSIEEKNFNWISRFFYDIELKNQLEGNVIFSDAHGFLKTALLGVSIEEVSPPQSEQEIDELNTKEVNTLSLKDVRQFLLFAAVLLIIVTILVLFVRNKSK